MKIDRILAWLDGALAPETFDDVSNNGLQIARTGSDIRKVAFAVDGSAASVRQAADAGAQFLVVHHGISWGGGIRRLTDGEYAVVKAAMDADLALAAYHLPLDANRRYGNNWELARALSLKNVKPAFSYHGNVIGVVGRAGAEGVVVPNTDFALRKGALVGVCSGDAGCFAADARRLGCEVFVTGEASWGEVVAAENIGMTMVCAGHYETETYGVRALARALAAALGVKTQFLPRRADKRAT